MLKTFYDFLIRHFKKKRKKSCFFLNLKKNIKYVFSNTVINSIVDLLIDLDLDLDNIRHEPEAITATEV